VTRWNGHQPAWSEKRNDILVMATRLKSQLLMEPLGQRRVEMASGRPHYCPLAAEVLGQITRDLVLWSLLVRIVDWSGDECRANVPSQCPNVERGTEVSGDKVLKRALPYDGPLLRHAAVYDVIAH
jgi:hypothetical protein